MTSSCSRYLGPVRVNTQSDLLYAVRKRKSEYMYAYTKQQPLSAYAHARPQWNNSECGTTLFAFVRPPLWLDGWRKVKQNGGIRWTQFISDTHRRRPYHLTKLLAPKRGTPLEAPTNLRVWEKNPDKLQAARLLHLFLLKWKKYL